jgi:hypothetical protein
MATGLNCFFGNSARFVGYAILLRIETKRPVATHHEGRVAMLPLNIRMIFAGVMALSLGAVTGRIIFTKTSVQAAEPQKVARVVVPAMPSNADAPTQAPAVKPESANPSLGRLFEASSTGSSAPAPAPVAELGPPLRKAEAPTIEEPARAVVPVRDAPNVAASKTLGIGLKGRHGDDDDDDDDDDPC